jgi:hypothetical protein
MFKRSISRTMILSLVLCVSLTTNVSARSGNDGWQTWSYGDTTAISVLLRSVLDAANNPHPHFVVVNQGNVPLSLGSLKLRYWFNCDCYPETALLEGRTDWAGVLPSGVDITPKVRGFFEWSHAGSQSHAAVIGFAHDAPELQPGQSVELHIRLNKGDGSNMPQGNDWSYAPYTNFGTWDRVTGYINGILVWGQEP